MAETSGPRGPCTAPRRRCCPAWPWTATAWARPRPDACPLQACPARCRPESTWPASTCTRTRVSALCSARPLLSPRDPAGEAGPGEATRSVPPSPRSHWGFGPSFSPDWYTGCPRGMGRPRGVSSPGAEVSLEALTHRGAGLCSLPQRVRLSRGSRIGRNRSPQGRFQTRGSCSWSLDWSFQNLGEKRTNPAPHPLETSAPELQCFSWQMSFQAPCVRGWALASGLSCGVSS